MDQTKRSRACEHELQRLLNVIDAVPVPSSDLSSVDGKNPKCALAQEEALIVFEDDCEPLFDVSSLAVSALPPCNGTTNDGGPPIVDRCIGVLSTLCVEGEELVDDAAHTILPSLLLYGEEEGGTHSSPSSSNPKLLPECASLRELSSFVPFLLEVSRFLGRISQVARNLLMQIHAFHSLDPSLLHSASDRPLHRCWRILGDLLAVLVQTDEVVQARPTLKQQWHAYAKSMETARHNPAQFGTTDEELRPFLAELQRIEAQLIAGNAFRNCYQQSFGALDDDAKFVERMKGVIQDNYDQWEKAAASDVPDKRRLTAIVALTTFYQLHFASKEKKLLKAVWGSHKKIVVFHLVGDMLWAPCAFLLREVPQTKDVADKKSIEFVKATTASLYDQQSDRFIEEAHALCVPSREWAAAFRLDMWQTRTRDAAECLKVTDVVLKGARLADTMSRLLKTLLNCASEGGEVSMSRTRLRQVMEVLQAIKLISKTFTDYWPAVIEVAEMAGQQWRCHLIAAIDHGRAVLRDDPSDARARDSLQALNVAATALLSSASRSRMVVASVALDVAAHKKLRSLPEWPQLPSLLSRLETLSRPRRLVARVCDCSFLLFHRHIFRLYFGTLMQERPTVEEITLTMSAATDCALLARKARQLSPDAPSGNSNAVVRAFQEEIVQELKDEFMGPLCAEIENDLRVLSHKHLNVDDRDKTSADRFEFLNRIVRAPALRVYDRVISIREFAESYLERTFYNLTAVSLHDCHTYAKMAMLAEFRYGLRLADGHLPYAILNQGLDVVHVMRALGTFTATYNYDLYNNLFVEKRSASRTLHVLSWEHMSNSLRTHGMGVVNTSVNLSYQLLRKRLAVVNQFLDDEHIKAMLTAETKQYEEKRKEWRRMYPVKRAERVARTLGELGSVDEDETYFDRFRVTVSQLGNALGFVRAMKAAADLVVNDALVYDRADEEWIEGEGQGDDDPTGVVKKLLRENRAQDARNRQYIEKLVSFFRHSFSSSPRFSHLSSLSILTPALTVNYVEHMLQCRERSRRRAPSAPVGGGSSQAPPTAGSADAKELTYVDDGFVLGMTYLLTVVDGWESFSALNWFRSVLERVHEERRRLDEAARGTDAAKTNNLKLLQLDAYEKEFKLLSYSFQSARMFFALDEEDPGAGKEEDEAEEE